LELKSNRGLITNSHELSPSPLIDNLFYIGKILPIDNQKFKNQKSNDFAGFQLLEVSNLHYEKLNPLKLDYHATNVQLHYNLFIET
jgi:hypothetical protein